MKSRVYFALLYCGVLFTGTVLTVTALCGWLMPIASAHDERILQKIQMLQQSDQRWIEIDRSKQRLVAWQGGRPVYAVIVSTGKNSTPTRIGTFAIQSKYRHQRMRGSDYDVPDVPYTMYYYGSYAIHGAYWNRQFGTPVSHGCVNVAVNHAQWLFNWAAVGTPVVVHE